jgi:group I intron endonuclease
MASGIYKIQSVVDPTRVYIGSAVDIKRRWYFHYKQLREGKHHSIKLQRHYDKYGKDDLLFTVIEFCDKKDTLIREQVYLDDLAPYFNICLVAGSSLGIKRTELQKEQIRKSLTRRIGCNLGRKASAEENRLNSERQRGEKSHRYGVKLTDETKHKIGLGNLGKVRSEEFKQFLSKIQRGKKCSEEHKQKVSEGVKRNWIERKLRKEASGE